ncbi:hypothetical protein CDG81_18780 [Actinopolyspora erythraea]|uniref:ATP-binding protein n=1 Tax=Actinopolyspora erythraea TaxID=414996 RepID=A0A099D8F2_9ACTN|nr:hypothetical protein [Actinopolyspora erythraea]ASU79968.1 hypothetical protein CDG81_18780 [Actinopolyspora erythraea]KGI82309.1 hypothetical protein IL38_06135 [Actinopolyspora erythraea]
MSDTETDINDVHGNVHSGSGDLYSGPTVVMNVLRETTEYLRVSGMIPQNDLGWLNRRFVPPQHFGLARDRLGETRTVLLHGPVGSGRRSAAKMLLHELSDEASSFAEFAEEAAFPENGLSPERVKSGQRLLLDLSHSDSDTLIARRRELPALRAVLEQRNAYLAIVLPNGRQDWASEELAGHTVEIARPSERLVLLRHLAAAGIELSDQDELPPELARYLEGPLREIAELAELARRVMLGNPDWSVSRWLREALAAVTERREEAADQVEQRQDARERAVLFAAAMCHGASADAVFFASQTLLELLELTGQEPPRLRQRGHLSQLDELGYRLDHGEHPGFGSFAYDSALRHHFWENYPDLRSSFCEWTEKVVSSEWLSRRDRRDLVDRYLEQALSTGCVVEVLRSINRWSGTERNSVPGYWLQFADQALVTGLNDQRYGARFRQLVYRWACSNQLPQRAGQLLVHVCTDVIAPNYPEQAIVRLHQRARREVDPAEPTARQALRETALADRGMLRRVIDRFATEFGGWRWWSVDLDLFVDVLDPWCLVDDSRATKPLLAESVVRSQLVLGWRALMRYRQDLAWSAVRWWLGTAGLLRNPDLLLWLLVEAAGYEIGALAALHVTARDWSRTDQGNPHVAARLTQLIDSYQGIDSADYNVATTAQEARP